MIKRDKALRYSEGYKYWVRQDYHIKLAIVPKAPIHTNFVDMDMEGNTIIRVGYAWNGASGPTWDTKSTMIPSLVHDMLYQLIRLDLIDVGYKEYADGLLHDIGVEDGMWDFRANYFRWAVTEFGAGSCKPSAEPPILVAP